MSDGNLTLSARSTHAIYTFDQKTVELVWTMGGKDFEFQMGEGADFDWQHDAHHAVDGTICLLDQHVERDHF